MQDVDTMTGKYDALPLDVDRCQDLIRNVDREKEENTHTINYL
jgi:hypothetical protein